MAAVLALVLAYLLAAAPAHWWPFPTVAGQAQSAPGGTTAVFAPPVADYSTTPQTTTAVEEDLAGFVLGYYRSMPDTTAGWPLIGPNLHGRGRASYDRFWGRYGSAEVLDRPSVRDSQVTVRIALHPRDGTATLVERHVLTIIRYDGGLRIDADEYLGRG
ncbi:hypothetical protein AB0C38_39765 [Amycolatopsis sp. NPDC048633]|uniref:hypothetical protein n=1 Tax=Amycolatopsis sp. NPDC048633 TaxID=3157095 RepID=UPI0033DE94D8